MLTIIFLGNIVITSKIKIVDIATSSQYTTIYINYFSMDASITKFEVASYKNINRHVMQKTSIAFSKDFNIIKNRFGLISNHKTTENALCWMLLKLNIGSAFYLWC